MPQLNVTIAGKVYRMACGEGEEAHLEALARSFDGKVAQMREAFGEIGDMRLHVMASLTLCDELAEARARTEEAVREASEARRRAAQAEARLSETEARVREGMGRAAERIERLARTVAPPPPAEG
jgi:cell division protein ZapA